MSKLHEALKTLTEQKYNTYNGVIVHESDPRGKKFDKVWDRTFDWFPWRHYEMDVVLWCEIGYGHYALTRGDEVLGMGKDVIQTKEFSVIGECASQDGEVYVSHNLKLK